MYKPDGDGLLGVLGLLYLLRLMGREYLRPRKSEPVEPDACLTDGVACINEERNRQLDVHGWHAGHDDRHVKSEMLRAAHCYIDAADVQVLKRFSLSEVTEMDLRELWPWESAAFKPSTEPIRNLEKAGALIAAEIDRLLRIDARALGELDAPPAKPEMPPVMSETRTVTPDDGIQSWPPQEYVVRDSAMGFYSKPKFNIWRWLGFGASSAPPLDDDTYIAGFPVGSMVTETVAVLGWKDRLRVLVSGRCMVATRTKTDVVVFNSISVGAFSVLAPKRHNRHRP